LISCRHSEPPMLYTTLCPSGENATLDGPLVSCGKNISR
jgi:hypothetical protein